jgi:ERF superfamily.
VSDKPSIAEALSAVMGDVQSVRKGDRNTQQNYAFRGIDAVVNAVGPAFRKHGVVCVPLLEEVAYNTVEVGKNRSIMRECTVRVRYRFYGPAGDSIECVTIGEAMDSGDKATPKAMSVAYRVALLQALTIPTDEPDADAQSYERSARPAEPQWDPVEQEVLYDGWAAEIAKATAEQIGDIGQRLLKAKRGGEMSPNTYQKLATLGGKRKGELDAEAAE